MVSLVEKIKLGDIGEIFLEGETIRQIRTRNNQLDVSTALLPNGEYETMILDYKGKRMDLFVERDSALIEALQTHFDHGKHLMVLAWRIPQNPTLHLIRSGELRKRYPGNWVAIYDGEVLAHDRDLEKITGLNYKDRNPSFHWVPNQDDNCGLT